ncbi:MAG: hypothetical protein GX620_10890 [Chloroflexi bacterium]|nr:hypothetical protein [Chloroflexota bacterium]
MSDTPMASRAPKRALAQLIFDTFALEEVQAHFHIGVDTDARQRLCDFTKAQLLELIHSTPAGQEAFRELESRYPLTGTVTFYVVLVSTRRALQDVVDRVSHLAELERNGGEFYDERRAVRAVYVASAGTYTSRPDVFEIPLNYERRFEYMVGDPTADTYGQQAVLYLLQHAYVWLVEGGEYGIVCGPDYVAVRPILELLGRQLGVRANLLNFDEQTIVNLAEGALPKSATFSGFGEVDDAAIDAKTITLYDPQLSDRRGYRSLVDNSARHQTAGFYADHPGLMVGGLGISSRFGRIWTPRRLTKTQLLTLALDVIERTRAEFARQRADSPSVWVEHFYHVQVKVEGRELTAQSRRAFDVLLTAYVRACGDEHHQANLGSQAQITAIIEHQEVLQLQVGFELECANCGRVLGRCPACDSALQAELHDGDVAPVCLRCGPLGIGGDALACTCGEVVPVPDAVSALWMFPEPPLLAAIRVFLEEINEPFPDLTFYVDGNLLTAVPLLQPRRAERIALEDLRSWRVVAHLHQRGHIGDTRRRKFIHILNLAREKCDVNHCHPTREDCRRCLQRDIGLAEINSGRICLARVMGLAINQQFDGIHHGHEDADVIFGDFEQHSGRETRVGIHLKSRTTPRAQGLGRSVDCIKGLYTQVCYSVYQVARGYLDLDTIGISVPNTLMCDVLASLQQAVNSQGLSFLTVDEADWLKILDSVIEHLSFAAGDD